MQVQLNSAGSSLGETRPSRCADRRRLYDPNLLAAIVVNHSTTLGDLASEPQKLALIKALVTDLSASARFERVVRLAAVRASRREVRQRSNVLRSPEGIRPNRCGSDAICMPESRRSQSIVCMKQEGAFASMQSGANHMAKFEFTKFERESLGEMHAITTDSEGSEVLFGLNSEETEYLMTVRRNALWHGGDACKHFPRAQDLQHKHNLARHEVLGALIHLRKRNLLRH